MKRQIVKVLISLMLTVTLIYPCLAEITVSATTTTTYSTCADHHFDNINGNVPKNVKSSCVLVALSMLLSFYDSYWSDDFVDESLEGSIAPSCDGNKKYPNGVPILKLENNSIPKHGGESSDAKLPDPAKYPEFAEENAYDYLHLYLIHLAANKVKDDNNNYLIDYQDESYSLNDNEAKKLLEHYLYNERHFTTDQIIVHLETSEGEIASTKPIYQSIKNKVSAGIPVYYAAENIPGSKKLGHAMVAYAFKDSDIKLHNGYTESDNQYSTALTSEYNTNVSFIWLEIKEAYLPHSCSNNYRWAPTNTLTCSCIAYKSLHSKHVHAKTSEEILENKDKKYHYYQCNWGDKIAIAHTLTYSIVDSSLHYAYCSVCNYTFTETHGLNNQTKRCNKCGYIDNTHYQPWQNPDDPKDELLE